MKKKTKRAFDQKVEDAGKNAKATIERVGQRMDDAKIFMADKAENISKKKEEVMKNMAESKAQFVEKAEYIKKDIKENFKASPAIKHWNHTAST